MQSTEYVVDNSLIGILESFCCNSHDFLVNCSTDYILRIMVDY
jgi:hypothetical protein